ncbi:MAG: DHH family phosphoesterase [Thermoguttaceae bacterium]|jgi:phosphoesterase RecJ-like protein|nr:DHH family phosphoesterase [Thermoguttaceae bacterium]
MPDWSFFVEIVMASRRFVITSHIRPDCDALGSELALAAVLEKLGKEVVVCNAFAVPPNYRFIDPGGRLRQLGVDVQAAELEAYEVLIILDTSAWAQLGAMGDVIRTTRMRKLVIDHHVGNDDLGAELFKNTHAEATGRLVIEAADALGVALTPEIAQWAFAALSTDTGWFRFSSTSADTLHLAGRLVAAGADPARLYKDLYEDETLARLKLTGSTLAKATTELNGRLIYTWIEQSDFQAAGAIPSDSEDMINLLLSVSGTEAAVIMVEQPQGGFKISFRSRCELDCSALASRFGGGGHKKAAGAFIEGTLPSVREPVLDAVRQAMQ